MPTFTQTGTVNGEPVNYDVVTPEPSKTIDDFNPNSPKGIAFIVQNAGNVGSVVTFGNESVLGGQVYGSGWYAKVSNQDFTSGSVLAPGAQLEIGLAVKADDPGVGQTAGVTVSVDIEHEQE